MYALPVAISGVDFPGQRPWRRFTEDDPRRVFLEEPSLNDKDQLPAATVDLLDFLKGTSRHILGQFRRNWSYLPGVFNLWFRSEIKFGQ